MNVEVTSFQPSHVEAVISIFRDVYGADYPLSMVYDADYWLTQNQTRELFTYVAETGQGEVVGLVSFYRAAPFGGLYEFGRLAVLPQLRQSGLGHKLLAQALEDFSKESEAAGAFGEMHCHWKVSQNMIHQLNFQDTALAVGLYPREGKRFSAVVAYFDMRDRAHKIYLPPRWKELILFCYDNIGLNREFIHLGQPLQGASQVKSAYLEGPAVARLDFQEAGEDFAEQLTRARAEYPAQIFQLRLNLEDPRTIAAAEVAYQYGYRCCGLLPRWFDGDGLLLQYNLTPPAWGHDQIASQRAQEMARRIEFLWK